MRLARRRMLFDCTSCRSSSRKIIVNKFTRGSSNGKGIAVTKDTNVYLFISLNQDLKWNYLSILVIILTYYL